MKLNPPIELGCLSLNAFLKEGMGFERLAVTPDTSINGVIKSEIPIRCNRCLFQSLW